MIKISCRRGFWSRGIARALSDSLHHPISPGFDWDSLKRKVPERFRSSAREMTSQWALKENKTPERTANRCKGKKRGSHKKKRYATENWRCKFHICPLKLQHKTDRIHAVIKSLRPWRLSLNQQENHPKMPQSGKVIKQYQTSNRREILTKYSVCRTFG